MIVVHVGVFAVGLALVLSALLSAIRTFVVPRGTPDTLTRAVFVTMRFLFDLLSHRQRPAAREQTLAFYAPVTLLTLPGLWLASLLAGYTALYWALGASSWGTAFTISRLSLLSLGSDTGSLPAAVLVAFSETVFSLLLVAILVSYLPTMYSAFSQREVAVTGLETRAGSPPTPVAMLLRYHRIHDMEHIGDSWPTWQAWFEVVEESHTALFPLIFYRSPRPDRSWVTAAGAVLDTRALVASSLESAARSHGRTVHPRRLPVPAAHRAPDCDPVQRRSGTDRPHQCYAHRVRRGVRRPRGRRVSPEARSRSGMARLRRLARHLRRRPGWPDRADFGTAGPMVVRPGAPSAVWTRRPHQAGA